MEQKRIKELVNSIGALQHEAIKQTLLVWKPKAERIISSNSLDINEIEHTLDNLCSAAFDDNVLIVFKKLCRYYYDIDPQATFEHIQIYREMWDSDDD